MVKDERFIRSTLVVATAVAILLIIIGCRVWFILPRLYEEQIYELTAAGELESAVDKFEEFKRVLAERLDDETKIGCEYEIACATFAAAQYEEAQRIFDALGDFKDSGQKSKECMYASALKLYDEGKYPEAAEMFRDLGLFSDSIVRYKDCRAAIAEERYLAGEYSEAINLLCELGNHPGAFERAYEIAMEITGDSERAEEMINGSVSPEEQERLIALELARQKLVMDKIAAGRSHSVAVCEDGTVLATGSNEFGQCNVKDWTDIVAVCAGADFTLGLRSDGTVLAVGSNEFGQCNVSEWYNVRSIAANDYDSLAVTTNGKLLSCGYHDYGDTIAADNIEDVYAGAYQAACILADGMVLSSHPSSATTLSPAAIVLSTAISVNLMWDGGIHSEFDRIPNWEDIVALTMNARCLIGLTADGYVESFFFRESDAVDFAVDDKYIVAAAAGGGHYLLVDSDGKVYAYGDNTSGQCDVSGWKIK